MATRHRIQEHQTFPFLRRYLHPPQGHHQDLQRSEEIHQAARRAQILPAGYLTRHFDKHALDGHRIPQATAGIDRSGRNEQHCFLGDLRHRDAAQNHSRRTVRVYIERV